jgi:phthiocerol/phenolphthiocerol synthesis type-I polyketide synthase E
LPLLRKEGLIANSLALRMIGVMRHFHKIGRATSLDSLWRFAVSALSVFPSFALPNGLTVFGFNQNDTLTVYRDIFDDDCYRRNGVTIRDGDCILDIGANTGLFIVFLNKIGVNVKVYGFEPAPATFEVLRQNVEAHNKLPVEIFNVGISRTAGQAEFTFYPRFSNASTLYPDESAEGAARGRQYIIDQIPTLRWPLRTICHYTFSSVKRVLAEWIRRYYLKKEMVTCQLWNLSEFIKKHEIAKIDLLKLDAEQSEEQILAGIAEEDWQKIRQTVIEVHGGESATRTMVELLTQRGFRTTVEPNPAIPTLSLVYGVRA